MKSESRRDRLRSGEGEKETGRGVCKPNIRVTAVGGGAVGMPSRESLVRSTSYQRGAQVLRTHARKRTRALRTVLAGSWDDQQPSGTARQGGQG